MAGTINNISNAPQEPPSHVMNFIEWSKHRHLQSIGLMPNLELTSEAKNKLPKHQQHNEPQFNNNKNSLNILYINSQSMNKKLFNINNQANSVSADIIVITETWHSDVHHYNMDSFTLVSEQARLNTTNNAGGVAIYVKNTIRSHFSPISKKKTNTNYAQDIQLCAIHGLGITIWGIYRSPNTQPDHDNKFVIKLKKLNLAPNDVVIGDYNLSTANWTTNTATDKHHANYLALFEAKGFEQIITEPTHVAGKTLDLVYAGHHCADKLSYVVDRNMKITEKDHFPIKIKYKLNTSFEERSPYLFKTITEKHKCDYKGYNEEIYDRADELENCNSEGADQDTPAINMTKLLMSVYDKYVPTRLIRVDTLGSHTANIKKFSNTLRKLRASLKRFTENNKKKNKIHKKIEKFSAKLKKESEKQRKLVNKQRVQKLAKSVKDTWQVMKGVGKPKSDSTCQEKFIKPDGTVTINTIETASLLINYYANITTNVGIWPDSNNYEPSWLETANREVGFPYHRPMTLEESLITDKTLVDGIAKLNEKSSPGFCGLVTNVVKKAGPGILTPLKNLYNNCIRAGVFPIVWKIAWIKSLPKKGGEAMDVANTRPISIIATLGKLFEICIGITEDSFHKKWFKGTKYEQKMPKCQYGFRTGSSCEDNLSAAIHKINHSIDNNFSVDVICYDYKKAFDSTTFAEKIRDKIETGLGELTNVWKSYFTDRYSFVRIREVDSELKPTLAGCPQGCPRSPHHFATYISELYPKDGHEINTEIKALTNDKSVIVEVENAKIISKFIDEKVKTAEDAIKFKIKAGNGELLSEYETWKKSHESHEICSQITHSLVNNIAANTDKSSTKHIENFIKRVCICHRRKIKPINNAYEDMYVTTYTDHEGNIHETQRSKQKRLTRHLTPSWYADDLKSISITYAEPKMIRLPGHRKLWPPHITFGDQQNFIKLAEEFNAKRQLSLHPLKCEILRFGVNNPGYDYYMQHPTNKDNVTAIKTAETIRDLGLWYRVNKRGYLDTQPTFQKMIARANAMIIATKRILKGSTLEKYNLVFHALIKSIFVYSSCIYFKNTSEQNKELHKIYKKFFANVPISNMIKNNEQIVLPETLVSFLRKLNLKRCHKILNRKTILDPDDFWETSEDGTIGISRNKMNKSSIKCWCNTITTDYVNITSRGDTRITDERLHSYMEERMLDDAYGLRLRLQIAKGAYEHSYRDYKNKVKLVKEKELLESEKSITNKSRIKELNKQIQKSNSANNIFNKISKMNDDELIAENKKIRMRTKTADEFNAMIRSLRRVYDADTTALLYET